MDFKILCLANKVSCAKPKRRLTQYLHFMATKINSGYYMLFIVIIVAFSTFGCGKNCLDTKYSFQLPVKAYPDKDTLLVGDTLWLEINESVQFTSIDGTIIDYSGAANLGSAIGFSIWDNNLKTWAYAVDSFSYVLVSGISLNHYLPKLIKEYTFIEQNGRYIFKLGIIPKAKGLHSLLFSNSSNTYRKKDKCTKANFTINFRNTNQHYYLSPFYTGQPNLVGGDYYFVVK